MPQLSSVYLIIGQTPIIRKITVIFIIVVNVIFVDFIKNPLAEFGGSFAQHSVETVVLRNDHIAVLGHEKHARQVHYGIWWIVS